MAEVIWSRRSLKDINEIAEYIANDSLRYAQEQVHQFIIQVAILKDHPLYGRMVPEINNSSVRQILCGHYRIIYEILNAGKIAIVTIHHQSRLQKNNPGVKKHLRRKK